MSDTVFLDPPIEVAAGSPRLEMILTRLKENGLRPYPARAPVDFGAADPLVIDLESVSPATLERCARACMAGPTRQLILVDTSDTGVRITDAIIISRDKDITQLKTRLASLARRDVRTREVARRRETATSLGAKISKIDPSDTPQLLYLGDGSETFLGLQGALKERGLSVTAALSLLTAQDYMMSRRFSAAIVDLTPKARDAGAFIDWTSPEGAPAGVALFALVDEAQELSDSQKAALAQAAEVIYCERDFTRLAARIEKLARQYMVSAPLQPSISLTSALADLTTGLFTRKFLEAHLEKQMRDAETHGQPISFLTVKLTGAAAANRDLLKALADCLRPIMRETDCAAVLGAGVIGISLLATPYRGAITIAGRIERAVARHPALNADALQWRAVERRPYHTAKTLLGAGVTGPFTAGRLRVA